MKIEDEIRSLTDELEHIKNSPTEDVCVEYNVDSKDDIIGAIEFELGNLKDDLDELDAAEEAKEYNEWLGWHDGDPDPAFSSWDEVNGMFYSI